MKKRIISKDEYCFCKKCNKQQYHKAFIENNYIYYYCYYHNILNKKKSIDEKSLLWSKK